ncbi:hypothetical protein BgiBS90_037086, partial [Biomphalaria glabrata]
MQSCLCEFCLKIFIYIEGINKFLIKKGHRELTLKNPASSLDGDGTLRKVTKWRPVNKEGSFNDLVRGITPNTIAYRNRSSFCFPCRNLYGSDDEICGSWKVFKLQKQNVVQSQSNLEDSLDVSPICSNSKAQTNSFTNQKYIVNSCVIVKYG